MLVKTIDFLLKKGLVHYFAGKLDAVIECIFIFRQCTNAVEFFLSFFFRNSS